MFYGCSTDTRAESLYFKPVSFHKSNTRKKRSWNVEREISSSSHCAMALNTFTYVHL